MLSFFRYTLRETGTNLWRNRLMTIAAILTVTVSLFLVGAALMLKQSASQASSHWQQGTRVTIWMKPTASQAEVGAVDSQLRTLPFVKSCTFYTQQQDYEEARKLLPQSEFSVLQPSDMPSSFRCTPTAPNNVFVVETSFTGQPGVLTVTAPEQQVRQMEKVIRIAQWVFVGLAGILLISATVLILNTIRMAIFARRREVAVMKLVGATNWFIRIPFISEGFFQGLIGSGLAVGFLAVFQTWYPLPVLFRLSTTAFIGSASVVAILGVSIGSIGSALAIRRFLDV
jgi:cell division transport system permease protein